MQSLNQIPASIVAIFANFANSFLVRSGVLSSKNVSENILRVSLENFVVMILMIYALNWMLKFVIYFLKIIRWILYFCIAAKIVLDLFNGTAVSNYSVENCKNSLISIVSSLRDSVNASNK